MSLTIYIPATAEPVYLTEMKNHVKADTDITTDDALIQALTTASRDVIETATGANCPRQRVIMASTFDYAMDGFEYERIDHYLYSCPSFCRFRFSDHLHVPRTPLISITSITYVDTAGTTQTLSSSRYSIADADMGVIVLAYADTWPSTRTQPNAVTIRFVSGMSAVVTAVAATDVCTVYGRTFADGDRVQFVNSGGALPTGLTAGTTYYIRDYSAGTFKVATSSGGSAIDITGAGSGTNYIGSMMDGFESLRAAMKLLVGFWYINREAVQISRDLPFVLPMAVESLVNAQHA